MLEVLRSPSSKAADPQLHVDVGFPSATDDCGDEFMVVDGDSLLSYTDFTCCDVPSFDADGDILPDLEVDPTELLAEFDDHEDGGGNKPQDDVQASSSQQGHNKEKEDEKLLLLEEDEEGQKKKMVGSGDEVVLTAVTTEDSTAVAGSSSDTTKPSSVSAEVQISKKKKNSSKNSNGKRKVDWTPELHRRFVQAVEQLGIDKAVPSRILEIMGIECLTRHNIASHLQKYRSHRKHLMAREAEAASWAQKRQMYAAAAPRTTTKDMPPALWVVPTIGFPPPLHVWGHPPPLPVFPRHLAPPPRPWAPVDPAASYWHQQYNGVRTWGPQAVTQGTPCVLPQTTMPPVAAVLTRFPAPPVPGMMPHPMYRPPPPQTLQLQLDTPPSKESIDAAIGDVLVKPWLPLPLGLNPPSLDSVMSELHKQGIPKIPPPATTTAS